MLDNPYAAPEADAQDPYLPVTQELSWPQLLFGLRGRIGRRQYWVCVAGCALLMGLAIVSATQLRTPGGHGPSAVGAILGLTGYITFLWVSFAAQVKRWHDRDKSAWWCFFGAIPLLNIWAMIELGFLPGTPGTNHYGPPPA